MNSRDLGQLEKQLRCAAACRRYDEVRRLASCFGEATRSYAESLPREDPRAAEAVRKLMDVLAWTLVTLQASRSACLDELRRLSLANRYLTRAERSRPPASVHMEG